MRALTLHQPWAFLVARGEKLIENRSWKPPEWLMGQYFAIHAGKAWDDSKLDFIRDNYEGLMPTKHYCTVAESGMLIGIVQLVAVVSSQEEAERLSPGHGKWFFGPYGWVLEDASRLNPVIECRGYQKLWNIPDDLQEKIDAQFTIIGSKDEHRTP